MRKITNVNILAVLLVFSASYGNDAFAGRVLQEPAAIKAEVRKMSEKDTQKALQAKGLEETCTRSMLKTREIQGVRCRMALHQALAKNTVPNSAKAFEERLGFAKVAIQVAQSVHEYSPMHPKPGFARHQFEAHHQSCSTVLDAYDAIKALPSSSPAEVLEAQNLALKGSGDAFNIYTAACDCTKKSLQLAAPAGLSLDESGALQGVLTSRGCLLNREKMKSEREGPSGFTGKAGEIAKANTEVSTLLTYAKARDIGLDRCREKYVSSIGRVEKVGGMERCVCDEVKRWGFPKKRGREDVEFDLPVVEGKLDIKLIIVAVGKVKECGPLSGSAIP